MVIRSIQSTFTYFNKPVSVEKPLATTLTSASLAVAGFAACIGVKRSVEAFSHLRSAAQIRDVLKDREPSQIEELIMVISAIPDSRIKKELVDWITSNPEGVPDTIEYFRAIVEAFSRITDSNVRKCFFDWIASSTCQDPRVRGFFERVSSNLGRTFEAREEFFAWISSNPRVVLAAGENFCNIVDAFSKISDSVMRREFLDWIASNPKVLSVAREGFCDMVDVFSKISDSKIRRELFNWIALNQNIVSIHGKYFYSVVEALSKISDPRIREEFYNWIASNEIIASSLTIMRFIVKYLPEVSDVQTRREFLHWVSSNPEEALRARLLFGAILVELAVMQDSEKQEITKFLIANTGLWLKCESKTLFTLQRIKSCFPEGIGNGVINTIYQNTVDSPQLSDGMVLENLKNILQGSPSVRAIMHRFLISRLEQETNGIVATRLAAFLYEKRDYFLIELEDVLFGYILGTLNFPAGGRNPYWLFKKFEFLANEPITDPLLPSKAVSSHILNTAKILETRQTSFTAAEIPTTIKSMNRAKLRGMIDSLLARYESLDEAGQAQFMDALPSYVIVSIGQGSVRNLLQNLRSPYLIQLLGESSEEEIPLDKAYFLALICSIYDQSNECIDGEFVSRQERALLIAAASIHGCPAGQQEGLRKAYNCLEAKYRLKGSVKVDELSVDQAKEVIAQLTQKVMEELITFDTPMMRELTGTDPDRVEIAQLSHQSIYVKNLIAHAIGLSHKVQFDRYTGCLSDQLLAKSPQKVLEIFHKHFMVRFKESLRNIMDTEASTPEKEILRSALQALGDKAGITGYDLFTLGEDAEGNDIYTIKMEAVLEVLSRAGNLFPNQNLGEPSLADFFEPFWSTKHRKYRSIRQTSPSCS